MRVLPIVMLCLGACAAGVDLSGGLVRVQLEDLVCGGVATSCSHSGRQTVDFDAGTLVRDTCVEGVDGGSVVFGPFRGDSVETHALSNAELEQVRQAVSGLRVEEGTVEAWDGAMTRVTITTGHGTQVLSPGAACGPPHFQRIVDGYPKLEQIVGGL